VMTRRKVFTARFELDEAGYWEVVTELRRGRYAISSGQTLPKVRRRIRQAIARALGVEETSFTVRDELALPLQAMSILKRYQAAREKLRKAELEAAEATQLAARMLSELGISRRDAGDLLGLTGARVHQVLTR
jgi:hypothetical protein